jgi:anti-sigma-K factor RskA
MSHDDVFDTLVAGYALGALDGEDLAWFESHLAAGCSRCEATLRECGEALAIVAGTLPRAVPPPHVKETLLRRVDGAVQAPGGRAGRRGWVRWAVAAAAAVVAGAALTGGFVAGHYEARLGVMAREASALREQLRRQEATVQDQLVAYGRLLDLLRDPATRVVALHGLGPSPGATARLLWNDSGGGQLFVAHLPPAPEGKTYELWAITGRTPRPAGVFQVDAAGAAGYPVEPVPGAPPVDVFAVTLEPAGGVPAPTGPMVLASR